MALWNSDPAEAGRKKLATYAGTRHGIKDTWLDTSAGALALDTLRHVSRHGKRSQHLAVGVFHQSKCHLDI